MARGDLTLFEEFANWLGNALMNFENGADTFKSAVIDNTTPPTAADTTPAWGDYSGNEVTGTGYTAGGATLANQSYDEVSGVATFDADDVVWTQNGAGPTDMYWDVNYDDSDTTTPDSAYCFVDMGGPVSLVDGNVSVKWNASGIFTVTIT